MDPPLDLSNTFPRYRLRPCTYCTTMLINRPTLSYKFVFIQFITNLQSNCNSTINFTVQAVQIGFLRRAHGVTLPDTVHIFEIREALNVEPLLRIERSELRWFGHVSRMSRERLARQTLHATNAGRRPGGGPRTRWSDYNCDLAWSRLGVEPADLSEIAVDHESFRVLLGLLLPRPPQRKSEFKSEWMNVKPWET